MSTFAKLFGLRSEPKKRIRVCVECGMPLDEHKDWCAILRGQKEGIKVSGSPVGT